MRLVRMLVSWVFFAGACGAIATAVRLVLVVLHPERVNDPHLFSHTLPLLIFFLVPTIVFGAAWWATLREKPSARAWGLAASVLLLVVQFLALLYFFRTEHNPSAFTGHWHVDGLVFAVSVAGLIAYGKRFKQPDEAAQREASNPLQGDGTFGPFNRYVVLLAPVAFYFLYSWWISLMRSLDLWQEVDFARDNMAFLAVLAAIVIIHELGHAIAAAALGMQFTSFTLGPFRLLREKCRWRFSFELKKCLVRMGGVGALPKVARPPRWHCACVAAAGPIASLLSSVIAVFACLTIDFDRWTMFDGYVILFAVMSLAYGLMNAIPLRVGQFYSDGARFYQSVASNAFCDVVRIQQAVMVVAQTALRPRDYDIEAIERALVAFPEGGQAFYLKLYVHEYCLEHDRPEEACIALKEAETIYDASALHEQTEVSFILAYAALCKDATAARRWWERMEQRRPDQSVSDYWLAKCALDCAEGRIEDGEAALTRADILIADAPATGGRAFDLDWSLRLRRELSQAAETAVR